MDQHVLIDTLCERLDRWITGGDGEAVDPWIEVPPDHLFDVCRALRDTPDLNFNMLHCITGVDYLETNPKKVAKTGWEPHFELLYHLSSMQHKHRIVIKVMLPRWANAEEEQLPEVPSVSSIWQTADWHEREVFDLCGVHFTGHPDLRRILCPEDWPGHPLRKDYTMPTEYHGIRAN